MLTEIDSLLQAKGKRLEKYTKLKNLSPIQIPIDEKFTLKEINLHKIMSIYESAVNNKLYNVHPELVHENPDLGECLMLCNVCYKSFVEENKIHPYSIAAGIDHGNTDRIGLVRPNVLERMSSSMRR